MSAPARGTRPRNRRALIVAAAAELFVRRGYPHVAMGDIADAVAIGPSALYRHFRGKQELLAAVVEDALTALAVTDFADLAAGALDRRDVGILWQRESRHLEPAERHRVGEPLRRLAGQLTGQLRDRRRELTADQAGLLAWSVLAVLVSVSFQRVDLPRPAYDELMTSLAGAVATVRLPDLGERAPERVVEPANRRELLLTTATRLFAERGFHSVSIEEVGAAAGITGPSVYHHFESKAELLMTALRTGADALGDGLRTASLPALLRSYAGYSLAHHDVVDLLITEVGLLPEPERHELRRTQREYVEAWVRLLGDIHPDLARVRVQAALTVVNDVARTLHLRTLPGVEDALCVIGSALLGLSVSSTSGQTL
ncbi:TetR/AcrR family transcriptional regulator [Amycolatopsis sp. WQ 127309]|uniref:TetR/AcrR family transcriptional regulator n=1 Tax=Amycolatopsis sp. WQ 127309 TaxID=2932773 RepID=UPI001FF15463|nr:TetR/AcrR family transcriptional regulator [Amycolatopsis sp. WQ 127309]UOZ09130.1 TetR/AcrR family transcriptional regulator [Amycolatopsis sp. WQ 127309]